MNRATWDFLRRHLPWALLLAGGVRWGLFVFERRIRADQHAQDLKMFKEWVRRHEPELKPGE